MPRSIPLLAVLIMTFVLATGCGGGGDKTFEESGFDLTFKYPDSFNEASNITVASEAGGSATDRKGVALDKDNLLLVTKFKLNTTVTEANVSRIKPEADQVMSQVSGTDVSGERVTVGGIPGFEYNFGLSKPANGRSRFVMLFDGSTEYTLNCQSTPEKRDEVEEACQQAIDTLEQK